MKRQLIFAAIAAITLCSTGCEKNPGTRVPERKDIVLTKGQADILNSGSDFNFDLLHEVATGQSSAFISPLSLQVALCMAANGSEGDTFGEIAKTIGYDGYSVDEINDMYNTLISGLAKVDKSTTFEIANSMWVNEGFPVYKSFAETLRRSYAASCENLDFKAPDAVRKINRWCSDNTHGMVPKIMDKINPDLEVLLINALYFKGIWAAQFDAANTREEAFKAVDGSETMVEMMHQTQKFRYAENDEAQFCVLPFGNKAYELDILLPGENVDFQEYVASLDGRKWNSLLESACSYEVILSVPKVNLERQTKLEDILQNMGITKAFSGDAEFPGISEIPLKIAEVAQKAVFNMDEKGAKAAAVTHIGFTKEAAAEPLPQVVFNADHPFVFAIRETTSSAILFIGTYTGR